MNICMYLVEGVFFFLVLMLKLVEVCCVDCVGVKRFILCEFRIRVVLYMEYFNWVLSFFFLYGIVVFWVIVLRLMWIFYNINWIVIDIY